MDSEINTFIEEQTKELVYLLGEKYEYYTNLSNIDQITEQIQACLTFPYNKCIECGTDIGEQNPRQLCGKSFCYNS